MKTDRPDRTSACDLAAGHALGALDRDDAVRFEAHLVECPGCRAECAALAEVHGELGLLAQPVAPPPALWERISRELAAPCEDRSALEVQPWRKPVPAALATDLLFVPGHDTVWEPTADPKIRFRRLHTDEQHDRITMLVQMDAGAGYPPHIHAAAEECFVLQGDLHVGEGSDQLVMQAGDYQRAEAGTRHPRQWTERGCVLFLISSLRDELDHHAR